MYFDLTFIPHVEELDLSASYGYENVPCASVFHLENMILEAGYNLVLDTAHLYMSEKEYFEQLAYLFLEYQDQIELIHLCDSTYQEDGLPFGEGQMNLKRTTRLVT